jgi:eukaryotic-like serine/threonine-protein kinase
MSSGESLTPAASPRVVVDPPPQAIAPGTMVSGRYRVVEWIGEGAMGAVYRVEETRTQKPLALKVLHASMSTLREAVARFEREAIAAGKINHPNVAAASDFGRMPDGSFFIILEFVAGRSLRAELDGGPFEPRRAVRIMQGVVAGVAAAHAKGIVHRDLKPENIMLVDHQGDPDFVKVLDFGIAKVADVCSAGHGNVAQTLTKAGTVIGTPDYMSPEQALGRAVDVRSDLYSLGVVLFELLTGSAPFRGGAATLLRQQVMDMPPPLSRELIEDSDPLVAEVLAKMLAKKPDERFQTATELMAALDALSGTLATKGVMQDLGLRSRRSSKLARVLQKILERLPQSSLARLTGRRVALTLLLLFAAAGTLLFFALRGASDTAQDGLPSVPSANPAAASGAHRAPVRGAAPALPPARAPARGTPPRKTGTTSAPSRE